MKIVECENVVSDLIKSDKRVAKFLRHIVGTSSNGRQSIDTEKEVASFIRCDDCLLYGEEGNARALLVEGPLNVIMCANRLDDNKEIKEALVHELTHAYDFITNRYDLASCEGLASSEIRAVREGECYQNTKLLPGWFSKYCVQSKASSSTNNLFPGQGSRCVERVFDKAFSDNKPFE